MKEPKLVRDLVPQLLRDQGIESVMHVAGESEYASRLADKLIEEAHEYHASGNIEELADTLEVIYAIAHHRGLDRAEMERLRAEKAAVRGTFSERLVLDGPLVGREPGAQSDGCLACDANQGLVQPPGGVIFADGDWVLEHSLSPVLLRGWLILKPSRHVEHVAELTSSERSKLGPLLARVSAILKSALGAERVYICSFGESVNHVHFYLIPRYAHMPANGVEVLTRMFSRDHPWACDDETAAAAAVRVRSAMAATDQ